MVLYCSGEILSKYWGIKPVPWLGLIVMLCYTAGSFCWLGIMVQRNQLALMSLIWQVLTTVISVAVGILYFHEKLTMLQWSGAVLTIIGFILLAR